MIDRRRARIAAAILGLTWLCARAEPAAAQADPAADRLLDDGVAAYHAQDYPRARALFAQAHAEEPTARTLRVLGFCDIELGQYLRAAEELEAALAETHKPLTDPQRAEVTEMLAKARSFLGRLVLDLQPADAVLELDGAPVSGTSFWLEPGQHALRVSAPDYRASTLRFGVSAGRESFHAVSLALWPPAAAEPIASAPAAVPAPSEAAPLPASPADLTSDRASAGRLRGIVGLSAGGAVLLAGGVVGAISVVQTNQVKGECVDGHCPKDRKDALSTANTLANVSNLCLALGALGIGYGLYELLTLPDDRADRAAVRVELGVTGAGLQGAF